MKRSIMGHPESPERSWQRLIEIAIDHFPDSADELVSLRAQRTRLELDIDEIEACYIIKLVGPEVELIESRRRARGQDGFVAVLAALATDIRDHEVADAKRLSREAAKGALTPKYARSLCEGFGYHTFDEELSRYQEEIALAKAARKRRGTRWWTFGGRTR